MSDADTPKVVPFMGNVSTFAARVRYVCPDIDIDVIHSILYDNVLGLTGEQFQALGAGSHTKMRARISKIGFLYLTIAEEGLCAQLESITGRGPEWAGIGDRDMVERLAHTLSDGVGQQARLMAKVLHIDLVTGESTRPPEPDPF